MSHKCVMKRKSESGVARKVGPRGPPQVGTSPQKLEKEEPLRCQEEACGQ